MVLQKLLRVWPQNISDCTSVLPGLASSKPRHFFPFTCVFLLFFFNFFPLLFVTTNQTLYQRITAGCPECTSAFIKSARLKSHHAPGKDNCKSVLTLPVPPECHYYSSSLGKGPHVCVSETTSVTPSIIINSRMNCSWDALRRHGNTRPNLCIHLSGPR